MIQDARGKDAGDRAVRFINALTHTKSPWAGKPFDLRDWQENDIIRPLFGTIRPDGLRQYRTCYVMIPRKNGKSELAAAIALYCLLGEGEIGGEIYSAAADRDQASLVFNVAAQMVRNDPELSSAVKIIDSQKRIVNERTGSFYRAISSEAHTKHGYNASVVLYDEVHTAPNRELWQVLQTSMGTRDQPLMFAITTAGYDPHSLERELFDYAWRVREGIVDDPTFLPVLYFAPDDADWTDETGVARCKPSAWRLPQDRGNADALHAGPRDTRPRERLPPALPLPAYRAGVALAPNGLVGQVRRTAARRFGTRRL